jgi:hypothetical protein
MCRFAIVYKTRKRPDRFTRKLARIPRCHHMPVEQGKRTIFSIATPLQPTPRGGSEL